MNKARLRCPRCNFFLSQEEVKGQLVDHCFRCGGTFLEKGSEAKILGQMSSQEYWKGTEVGQRKISYTANCPLDGRSLTPYCVSYGGESVEVDICPSCEGLWLDPKEGKALADIVLHAGQDKAATFNEKPGFKSYLFQAFSGLPVEAWNPVHHRPIVTIYLIVSLVLIFIAQLSLPVVNEYFMLNTQDILAGEHIWTLVSSGFLHLNIAHLLGNLYFLYIFGDNVEDHLGKFRFIVFYLCAIVFSCLTFVIYRAGSEVYLLGASGAIAGLMGAYIVMFPKVKLYFTLMFIPFRLSVLWYLSFWLLFNVLMMLIGGGGVAWSAHVGGFVFGLAGGYFLRFRSIKEHILASSNSKP